MDNKQLLEQLSDLHTQARNLQYNLMSLMEKIENEEIIKAKGYNKNMEQIIDKFIKDHGNILGKLNQTELYNQLKEYNINRLTLYRVLKELNYTCKYHDNGTDWKNLEIIKN